MAAIEPPGSDEALAIAAQFAIGRPVETSAAHGGHINDSFCVACDDGRRFLLQRVNTRVFPEPLWMTQNILLVTRRLAQAAPPHRAQRTPRLVPGRSARENDASQDPSDYLFTDDGGGCWRMQRFIERTRTVEFPASASQAEQAAWAIGGFQREMLNLPAVLLHETLPGFHDTPGRYAALERAIHLAPRQRASAAAAEIGFARARASFAGALLGLRAAGAPLRVTHNDAKMSNVLLDDVSGEAVCVVDLDTVMPGLSLFDFGDMARSMTCPAAEDETDLSRVEVSLDYYAALKRGYLATMGPALSAIERENLGVAARVITLEQGVRFLTDYLSGDRYYRTNRPWQNLDRCRVQFRLVEHFERRAAELEQC